MFGITIHYQSPSDLDIATIEVSWKVAGRVVSAWCVCRTDGLCGLR